MTPPRDLLRQPPRTPLVGASILSADFARLGEECEAAMRAGCDLLHLDVMDGHFVPNLTMGPALCRSLRKALPDVWLDVHLMVTDPRGMVQPFAKAGADLLTFHIEVEDSPAALAGEIRAAGMSAGISLNPQTPVDHILPHLDAFDLVLIMSVNPGFSGQAFIEEVLGKAVTLRDVLRPEQRVAIDGGVNAATAGAALEAGCDILIAASAIFGGSDYAAAVQALRAPLSTGSSAASARIS